MIARDQTLPGDGLSLVRDDLLFRVQRRVGLIPAEGLGLVRRAFFWSLLAWAPIALWAWYAGRVVGAEVNGTANRRSRPGGETAASEPREAALDSIARRTARPVPLH